MTAMAVLLGALVVSGLGIGPSVPAGASSGPKATSPTENDGAYAVIDAAGGVITYGGASYSGDTLDQKLHEPIAAAAADPSGGYWLAGSRGTVHAFGGAVSFGSASTNSARIVGMAATPDGRGYWLVASNGTVSAFGDAQRLPAAPPVAAGAPVVGMAASPSGQGYWLVDSRGRVSAFGTARRLGSATSFQPGQPVVGMAATSDGRGYWLVASDGRVAAFGSAPSYGSLDTSSLSDSIVGIGSIPHSTGYRLVAQDGAVFSFGGAVDSGSVESPLRKPLYPTGFTPVIPRVVAIIPDAPGPQAAHQGRLRVAFAGDSLAFYEGLYSLSTHPPYLIDNGSTPGCGITNGAPIILWKTPSAFGDEPPACATWPLQMEWFTARFHPDVTVLQAGYWESQKRFYDGSFSTLKSSAYAAYILANLERAVAILHRDGAQVLLATSPQFNDETPSDVVVVFNRIVAMVAAEHPSYVTVFDVNRLLDPHGAFATVVKGVTARSPDGVHFTKAGVVKLLDGPMNAQIAQVGQPVYRSNR
jgi:hypothetical protein